MGYLSWGTKSSKKGGRKPATPPPATVAAAAAASGGCMNAVLHMFDFQRFQLCLHPQLDHHDYPPLQVEPPSFSLDHHPTPLKGVEAPRNSLEIATSLASITGDDNHIGIEINTRRRDTKLKLVEAESMDSPRTPSLVARLMGLDILPESSSTTPRFSLHSPHITTAPPRISKIETPRRLSLQINKENSIVKEIESSRPSCSAINTKRKEGRMMNYHEEVIESRSPGYYASQIMKQARESVSRRVGVDITNTVSNGQRGDNRRDEHLLSTKNRKPNSNSNNPFPKVVRTSEPSSKASILNSEYAKSEALQVLSMPEEPLSANLKKEKKKKKKTPPKSLDLMRNKKEEQFVRPPLLTNKKCKKTPLSSELLHLNKDSSKLLHRQGSSSKAQPSKPNIIISKSSMTGSGTGGEEKEKRKKGSNCATEFQYISRILKCTGIDRDTPVTLARWFSSSHPLDPSIFHNLENAHYADDPFFSRKLIFDLVNGILADLLKPYIKLPRRSWMFGRHSYHDHQQIYGFQLVKILCSRIRSFPSADCQILQDIDALVEKDLPKTGLHIDVVASEEEGDAIVSEIQCHILDSLVHEIAVICLGSRGSNPMQRYMHISECLSTKSFPRVSTIR